MRSFRSNPNKHIARESPGIGTQSALRGARFKMEIHLSLRLGVAGIMWRGRQTIQRGAAAHIIVLPAQFC